MTLGLESSASAILSDAEYDRAMDAYIAGSRPDQWGPAEKALRADRAALLARGAVDRPPEDGIPPDLLSRQFRADEGVKLIDGRILLDAGSSGPMGWSTRSRVLRCPLVSGLSRIGRGIPADPLVKGSLVHVGTAHYYARVQALQQGWTGQVGDPTPGPAAYLTPLEAIEALARQEGEGWMRWVPLAQQTVSNYIQWHKPFHEHVIAVEHLVVMDVPWTRPDGRQIVIPHTTRIDLITGLLDRRARVVDHKSTSTAFKETTPYDLSGQIVGLTWWGSQAYGDHFGGVELNVMRLPRVDKQGVIGDVPKVQFERMTPKLAPHAVRNFPKTVAWSVFQQAMLRREFGPDPTQWPMALSEQGPCLDKWGACGFREFCRWGAQEGLATRSGR